MKWASMLLFLLIFNTALPFGNQFNTFLGIGGQPVQANQFTNPNGSPVGTPNVVGAAGCTPSSNGLQGNATCPSGLGSNSFLGSVTSTVLTFGDFLWSFVKMIPLMMLSVMMPGFFLVQYLGNSPGIVIIAGIFTVASWYSYYLLVTMMVSGRYVESD